MTAGMSLLNWFFQHFSVLAFVVGAVLLGRIKLSLDRNIYLLIKHKSWQAGTIFSKYHGKFNYDCTPRLVKISIDTDNLFACVL